MHIINVTVRKKVATADRNDFYVCGNSDFAIHFDFDEEWEAHALKTARFIKEDGTYTELVFTRNECPVPIIENTYRINVGVYAGNLSTTTPAYIPAKKSILCGGGVHVEPEPDVYNQILERIDTEIKTAVDASADAEEHAEEALLLAQAANKSATNASVSAAQAQTSQRAAATSASQAYSYQGQASVAANAANSSAARAQASQTKAEAAAKRAEDAANSMGGGGTVSPGDGKLKADAIICDKSGESVSISDASERDALSVVSHISAPEGVTGIKLTRTGRNIFGGMALVHSIVNQAAGSVLDMDAKTVSYSANNVGGKTLFEYPFKDNTQYTLYFTPAEGSSNSPNMQVFYVGETEGVRLAPITNKTVWVYKTASGKTVERIAGRSFSGTSILLYEQCGIFEGVLTEADFVPYEAETFTVALPETVTDGTFDWATGVLTINQDGASRTVQLDAQPIAMRDMYNTLWSSTGQTDVRYVADTKAYVDGHGADADSEYADNAGYAENAGYADNAGHAEEAGDAQTVKGRDIAAEVDALSVNKADKFTVGEGLQMTGDVLGVVPDGEYELLHTVTTTEAVEEVRINTDSNGNSFMLDECCIEVEYNGETNGSLTSWAGNGSKIAAYNHFDYTQYNKYTVLKVYVTKGYWDMVAYNANFQYGAREMHGASEDMFLKYRRATIPNIDAIRVYANKGGGTITIPVGTVVKLWGVRANA